MKNFYLTPVSAGVICATCLFSGCGWTGSDPQGGSEASELKRVAPEKEHLPESEAAIQELVLRFGPVGYWPANEGEGTVLRDRSGNDNDGRIYNVPWRDGSLIFDNDTYQWIQVPYTNAFGAENFSMGGWLFSAHDLNPQRESRLGAILVGQPFRPADRRIDDAASWANEKLKWESLWGERTPGTANLRYGLLPNDGTTTYLEVASGEGDDVLGTVADEVSFSANQWQHLFYTYDAVNGKGSLYLNGGLVKSVENVPWQPSRSPLVIGAGRWGTFNLGGNASLDGTLRQIAFFDRTLTADEVKDLCDTTKPLVDPQIEPYSKRYARRNATFNQLVRARSFNLEEYAQLTAADLIAKIQDQNSDQLIRAKAVLQLASMESEAQTAIPVLAAELRQQIDADGAHLPKIEEVFRNSLIRALLDIGLDNARVNELLVETLLKPFFEGIDTNQPYFNKIRPLIQDGKWFEGLAAYHAHVKSLPKVQKRRGWGSYVSMEEIVEVSRIFPLGAEYFDGYLIGGVPYTDAGYSAYNIVDNTPAGYSYLTMIEPISYEEAVRRFDKHLKGLTDKGPGREATSKNGQKITKEWTRVKIVKISPDGKRESSYLHGEWFIFDGRDEKMYGWSVISDEEGYIHLLGGQHNTPMQNNYIPGSWEKLGIARGEDRPSNMYWVSKRPHDITEFEFVGKRNNPRALTGGLNYMSLARSRSGEMFLYARGSTWNWALHRYDADKKRWIEIKGSQEKMMEDAKKHNAEWYANLGRTVPYHGPSDGLVFAWQPGAYNFNRTWPHLTGSVARGITFDLSGRMHVGLAVLGVIEGGEVAHRPVYAYSDDLGETFHRADGEPLKLPLTNNPIPGYNADRTLEPARTHFEVWASLVRELNP